jgi:hypothetical protein
MYYAIDDRKVATYPDYLLDLAFSIKESYKQMIWALGII